jgi:dTDP-4-amino-4,6-dideoxygalactose transaminase
MVLMNNFKLEAGPNIELFESAFRRVVGSGTYILGQECKRFEEMWASKCGVNYGVGVGNGMDAIEIVLRSVGVGVGDEVITTSMTAFATVLAIIRSGATPVLADIDPATGIISIDSVKRCLTNKTRAVVIVHLYGQIRKMLEWQELCESNGIYLIEDCAQAHLATENGRRAGCFGVAGTFSFYPTKNLGAFGDAGMIVTNSSEISAKCSVLRNYGQSERYHHPLIGLNSRLDEVHAAVLIEKLKLLENCNTRRKEIASRYRKNIRNPKIQLLSDSIEQESHVYHLFVILCGYRDDLMVHLANKKIQSLIHYPIPIHLQDSCNNIKRDPSGLINSECHANNCISLPCHPYLTESEIQLVIDAVNSF